MSPPTVVCGGLRTLRTPSQTLAAPYGCRAVSLCVRLSRQVHPGHRVDGRRDAMQGCGSVSPVRPQQTSAGGTGRMIDAVLDSVIVRCPVGGPSHRGDVMTESAGIAWLSDIPHERVAPNEEFPDDDDGRTPQWFDGPEPDSDAAKLIGATVFPEWVVRVANVVVVRAPNADEALDVAEVHIDAGRVLSRQVTVDRKDQ